MTTSLVGKLDPIEQPPVLSSGAHAAETDAEPESNDDDQSPFFTVSVFKFVVMCIFSLGLYQLYWFYQNWRRIRTQGEGNIWPFWRTVFGVFFCYPCFKRIKEIGDNVEMRPSLAAGGLAAGWILSSLMWRAASPVDWISAFSWVFVVPVQAYVNRMNVFLEGNWDRNAKFTGWNWALIIVVGIFYALAAFGTYLELTHSVT